MNTGLIISGLMILALEITVWVNVWKRLKRWQSPSKDYFAALDGFNDTVKKGLDIDGERTKGNNYEENTNRSSCRTS